LTSSPHTAGKGDSPSRRVAFATVGCRLNQAETDAATEEFLARGWEVVPFQREAEVYFVNTCTVTGQADRSSRQLIHRARRINPSSVVIAAGCFAVRGAEELAASGEVDLVLGIREKAHPFEYLPGMERPTKPAVHIDPGEAGRPIQAAVGTRVTGRSRAFLKVQDGCDHACAYCAVTLARGASRSAPLEEVRAALERVHAAGFEEVVITGVDITSYGRDLPDSPDFVRIVAIAAEVGLPRVRLSSVEPWELSPERMERLAAVPAWCHHLHLSLQSADPAVLERMNRATDLDRLRDVLRHLLTLRPDSTFGADLIVGFPGESEMAHERSISFVRETPLHYLHVFPYSPRPGTPAASLPDRVAPETIKRRAEELRRIGREIKREHLLRAIGKKDELLVEQDGQTGYTRAYLRARLENERAVARKVVAVTITGLDEDSSILQARIDS